jgi:DNA-binding MurR/RpiR family transcriptional regulator
MSEFKDHSAFTRTPEQEEHLESLRKQALAPTPRAHEKEKRAMERNAAIDMLEAAANLLDEKEFERAIDLIHQARDLMNDETV